MKLKFHSIANYGKLLLYLCKFSDRNSLLFYEPGLYVFLTRWLDLSTIRFPLTQYI